MKLLKNFALALLLWFAFFTLSVALLHLAN
jgi:hypothetical protein